MTARPSKSARSKMIVIKWADADDAFEKRTSNTAVCLIQAQFQLSFGGSRNAIRQAEFGLQFNVDLCWLDGGN